MFSANSRVKNIQLHEALGSGAYGTVFRATDILLNRECAIKFVPNTNPTAFDAHLEGQVLQHCKHDNVVEVLGCDVYSDTAGNHYAGIEMTLMRDGSAENAVSQGYISARTAIKMCIDVLFALEHTHGRKTIHRDIKPANVMLHRGGAKLSDFGLATAVNASGTASGKGSPVYCAPEVFSQNITNEQTDVFSVGMTLFQLLNQITAPEFDTKIPDISIIKAGKTIKHIGYANFVPRKLRQICNRACAVKPVDRYESAHKFRQALEGLKVALDWKRTAPSSWIATTDQRVTEMTMTAKKLGCENTWTINSRRANAKSTFHFTHSGCIDAQERAVYATTF